MTDKLSLDWVDVIIRENDLITVTQRIVPSLSPNRSFSIDPERSSVIGYHLTCKAHRTTIEVDEHGARRMNSASFCKRCVAGAPADPLKLSEPTKLLLKGLLHQGLSQSMNNFIDSLDI